MSIQLTLSGHSFSRSDLPRLSNIDEQGVNIEVITERTMLAPTEILDPEQATELMLIAGFCLDKEDQVVIARDEKTGIAALMALPQVLVATVEERYGDHYEFTTPLLRTRVCPEPTAWLYLANGLIYIKVWDGGKLRMAEVLPRKKEEDSLYYAAMIDRRFGLNSFRVVVSGTKAVENEIRSTAKLLNKFYKKVVCE
jgi:hypothetical protein